MVAGQPESTRLMILYGSETGNAQDLAKIVGWTITGRIRRSARPNLTVQVMSCDDYPIDQLPDERLVLFICSTTGVGEEPQNMKRFWRFLLRRDLPSDSLTSMSFGVIGLGDSSYSKYNFVAKKLHKRLLNLGATSLLELALGDDQHDHGPYAKIDPWLKEFYSIVVASSDDAEESKKDDINDDTNELIEPSFKFTFLDEVPVRDSTEKEIDSKATEFDALCPYSAKVSTNTRVTSEDHFQDVRLMSLEIAEPFHYNLGDVCSVYPENSDEDVEQFLTLFEDPKITESSQFFRAEEVVGHSWIAKSSFYYHLLRNRNPCSVHELVKTYMDINSIPKRSFFYLYYRFSKDELERNMLKRFAEGADLDELYDYVNRPKRTILEVMADFPHTTPHVPFEYLLDLIPAISARPYSVASSPATSPGQIDLLYAVVEYRTRMRKPRLGLCTNWMAKLGSGDRVRIFLRPSNFTLPKDHPERPLMMIGAGTGVAPFRAFIHDRTHSDHGRNYLFFGCRYREHDYYLEHEWRTLGARKLLTVFEAFSRENPDASKVYVQNRMWDQRELVFRLLMEQNGLIWIAGKSQQYPQLIRETIVEILRDQLASGEVTNDTQLENLVNQLELRKRIQFECW